MGLASLPGGTLEMLPDRQHKPLMVVADDGVHILKPTGLQGREEFAPTDLRLRPGRFNEY